MKSTIYYCDLPNYKFPKLQELHTKIFNKEFSGAHQAINDVKATANCFFKLKEEGLEMLPEKDSLSNYPDYESYIKELRNDLQLQISNIHALLEILRLFMCLPKNLNTNEELKFLEENFYNYKLNTIFDDSRLSENQKKFFRYQEKELIDFFDLTEIVNKLNEDSKKLNIKPKLGTTLWFKSRFNEPKSKEDYYAISKQFHWLLITYKHWINSCKTNSSASPNSLLALYNEVLEKMYSSVKNNNVDYFKLHKVLFVAFYVYQQEDPNEGMKFYLTMVDKILDEAKQNLEELHILLFIKLFTEIKNQISNQHRKQVDKIIENLQKEEGGCFIATLCYGSYSCEEVIIFRRFRDEFLVSHFLGKLFIKFYYYSSPIIVKQIGDNQKIIHFIRNNILEPIRKRII